MKAYFRPTKLFLFSTLLAATLDCGTSSDSSTLKGRVSDGSGSQPQSLKVLSDPFGGSGSVSAAVKVRVSRLKADGTLSLVVEGQVKADGHYELTVPPGEKRLICESLDASGKVLASAIVEVSGNAGETVTATPMDTESSVEAAVLAKMAASGTSLEECNAIDLRERITVNVAQAVKASADADVKIKALAEAVAAAQTAKIKAYASAGVNTTQAALFNAEVAAAKKLNAALDASANAAATAQAYAEFHTTVDAELMAMGGSPKKYAQAESCSSVAFRATVKARLNADAVADASLRAAASHEARVSAAAVSAILAAGSASAESTTAAANAAMTLRTQMSAAASASESATAFSNWNAALSGNGSVNGSVLGNYLGLNIVTAATVQPSLTLITTAATALDTTLKTLAGTLSATGTIDINGMAQTVVSAYSTFQGVVDAQSLVFSVFNAKGTSALDVMATASGSFRLQ